jgi:hypothetical protein
LASGFSEPFTECGRGRILNGYTAFDARHFQVTLYIGRDRYGYRD